MFTNVNLSVHVVWETALWSVTAIWTEDEHTQPVVLEKAGQCPIGFDESPDAVLLQVVRQMQGQALRSR